MNDNDFQRLVEEQGKSPRELIVLASQNDPYFLRYSATSGQRKWAKWFAGLWQDFGYTDGVHLRRIHYRLVSQDPQIEMPNGKPYTNTTNNWKYLTNASKYARYRGLVDPAAFVDRRNPEAIVYTRYELEGDRALTFSVDGDLDTFTLTRPQLSPLALPELPPALLDWPRLKAEGFDWLEPPYHVEIWCEKTTVNDVIVPFCRRHHLCFVAGSGELSITAALAFLNRVRQAGRPARILYISDFDPSGRNMPVSVARKIEIFQEDEAFKDLDIRLEPIVLTRTQVSEYQLPRTPLKESDLLKGQWEESYGEGLSNWTRWKPFTRANWNRS